MPGLARALRQKRAQRAVKPFRVFDNDARTCNLAMTPDGVPTLVFGVRCTPAVQQQYEARLRRATGARVAAADDLLALDLLEGDAPAGRLATSIGSPVLAMLVAAIDAFGAERIGIGLKNQGGRLDEEPEIVFVPVTVERFSPHEIHGPPVEVGHGPYATLTINRHDATMYVQRFRTEAEATAQHARNVEADLPFVGAPLN